MLKYKQEVHFKTCTLYSVHCILTLIYCILSFRLHIIKDDTYELLNYNN